MSSGLTSRSRVRHLRDRTILRPMSNQHALGSALGVFVAVALLAGHRLAGQQPAASEAARTPRAAATSDLTGHWVSVVTEEWRWRMITPPKGDYTSIPLSD